MVTRRQEISCTLALAIVILSLLAGCGGSEPPLPPGAPPAPQPSDPWFGTAGNVLISDRGFDHDGKIDYIWIGFNSQAEWQNFLALRQKFPRGGFWIGGRVVVTSSNAVGFYFDPASASAAEVTAEGIQTSLDGIKS